MLYVKNELCWNIWVSGVFYVLEQEVFPEKHLEWPVKENSLSPRWFE